MNNFIMINDDCSYKEKVKSKNSNVIFKIDKSGNLLYAVDDLISVIDANKYEKIIAIWVTGVAFTNLLTKKYLDKNIFTVPSINYLKEIKKNKKIDVLVLGMDVLGQKNLNLIIKEYLKN